MDSKEKELGFDAFLSDIELLAERARKLAVPGEDSESEVGDPYLVFAVADEKYCLHTENIESVVAVEQLTEMPGAPAAASRLFSSRGKIYSAVTLENLLGTEVSAEADKAIILRDTEFALLCGGVAGIVFVAEERISSDVPSGDFVTGVLDDKTLILDSGKLLNEVVKRFG
ncbi:MAG: chemotaxis protein CheW [bacterium]|nr:chemotaxis protein CheW [bacterium]